MKRIARLALPVFLLAAVLSGTIPAGRTTGEREPGFRIMFYNVENLFDTLDHPGRGDDEFTPGGERAWNGWKYRNKLQRIFQAVAAAGGWEPPEIIGLCEVENRTVVEDLFRLTPLVKFPYSVVHEETPDERGIDLALAYRKDRFTLLDQESWQVRDEKGGSIPTRSILHVTGKAACGEKVHLVLAHWPSRFNVQEQRELAARTMIAGLDSVFRLEPEAMVIVAGDFNDNPGDPAPLLLSEEFGLLNLVFEIPGYSKSGSIKYLGKWYWFDQMMLSSGMTDGRGLDWVRGSFGTLREAFLLEKDLKYTGEMPFRSFSGYRYTGGFSDHLPVVAAFECLP